MKKPIIKIYSKLHGNLNIWSTQRILIITLLANGQFYKLTVIDEFQSSRPFEMSSISEDHFITASMHLPFDVHTLISCFFSPN